MGVGDRPAIIYSMVGLIGRERSIVLCEHQVSPAGCDAIARKILAKIAPRPDKKSYGYEGHIYHFVSEESGLVFMCTADEKMSHRVCFAFLQDIRKHFLGMFGDSYMRATECSLNERFRILGERMEFFSFNPEADKTRKVEHDLEQVQNQMRNNIDKVLDRGNRLETLVDATETLDTHTTNFRSVSTTLRRNLWWKNMKTWILLILTIFACIFLVTVVILVALRIIP